MVILTGIISKIIEYTVEPVGRQVGYLINYKSNLQSLRSQLDNLNAAKDRMKHRVDEVERNGKGVETDVQNWRQEADRITQEADNILGNEGQAKTKCFRGVCPNLISYHQLSRESSKLAKKIELHKQVEFPRVSYDAPVEDIAVIASQDYMAFESRISMVNKIMAELRNPGTNLVGVYGLGGIGKTTLAKEVFRQANNKEEKLFDDVVIILNVKEKPGREIQKEIADKLGMEVKESQSMAVRANCLCRRIKDKKTLVILDDVFGRIDLEEVGVPCVPTCKLLLTSRDRKVLVSVMRTQKDFPLNLLCQTESWSLFKKMAGDVVENDRRIQTVANKMAKKCGGLPILIVAVASALRESSLEEWKDALRRFESFDRKGLTEDPFLGLEWSYNQLDKEELQPLFRLCGIMAQGKDTFFLSDMLKYTIGLGLVKNVRTVEEARNALHSLVRKLKYSSLLLDGYNDRTVRMHDVVRDVAVQIACRDQHVLSRAYTELDESPSKECSIISLRRCTISKLPEAPWECPKLTMFYLGASDNSLEIPSYFFEEMKELKVLDLTGLRFPSLPPSLTVLTNLQSLCLDQCILGDIALVGQLTNLKILSLIHSEVKELPKQIGQLTRLQLLDLSYCSNLVLIPYGVISSLTRLEDLRINSFKQWEGADGRSNASIIELKHLSKLTALEMHIPDANILPTNFFSDKLERYIIVIGDRHYLNIYGTSSNMLKLNLATSNHLPKLFMNGEVMLPNLTTLIIHQCDGLRFLFSVSMATSLVQLTHLEISSCQIMEEIVTKIGTSDENTEKVAFPSLERLKIYDMPKLMTIWHRQLAQVDGSFRKLKKVEVLRCHSLISIFAPSMMGRLNALETLKIEECKSLQVVFEQTSYDTSTTELKTFECPNLDFVQMDSCESLKNIFPASVAKGLQQLSKLHVQNCGILEEIVAKEGVESTPELEFVFPKVTCLTFYRLPQLRSFYPGLHVSKWPLLKELNFRKCCKVEIFASEYSRWQERLDSGLDCTPIKQPFFLVDKVLNLMPNLTSLRLYQCEMMEEIVSSGYNQEHSMFCNLKSLWLQHLPSLTRFCSGSYIEFSLLGELFIDECPRLGTFIFDGSKSEITTTGKENDDRSSMENLETVTTMDFLFDEKVGFPSLEKFTIWDLPTVMTIWHNKLAPNSFCKLRVVNVSRCDNLINIFAPSMMGRLNALEKLDISTCKSLQAVFKEIVANEGVVKTTPEFEFPKLTSLTFVLMPQLRSFYPEPHVSKWPLLKEVFFVECGKVEIFASEYSRLQERLDSGLVSVCTPIKQPFLLVDKGNPFPNLERLDLDRHTEIWYAAHGPLPAELFINLKKITFSCAHPNSFAFLEKLHGLEELQVYGGPWKEIFEYEGTSSGEIDAFGTTIKNLCLENMKELMHLRNDNSESIFPNLEILKVSYCDRLKNLTSSAISFRNLTSSAISFRNLTTLDVLRCHGLKYLVTYSVAKCLHQLKTLKVQFCESIIEIVASNVDEQDSENYYEIAFNCLQHLELWKLPSLRGFCSSGNCTVRVPSLNSLDVRNCLIKLKISPDGSLIQSGSRPERQQITEEEEEEEEKEEEEEEDDDDGNETGGSS